MRYLTLTLICCALLLSGCSAENAVYGVRTSQDATRAASARVVEGRKLLAQGRYREALDTFVDASAEDGSERQAVAGALQAFEKLTADQRLPDRVREVVELRGKLPRSAGSDLQRYAWHFLVDPVANQARQGRQLLADRRRFVEQMRDTGEGDEMPVPQGQRILTESEVADAREKMDEIGATDAVAELYDSAQDMAAAMDRFYADDERYLGTQDVTDEQLDEISDSCDALAEALGPVQDKLDEITPGWRDR